MRFNFPQTKVLRISYSHYTSLPIQWVRDLNIRKGTKLNVSMDEQKRLIIEKIEEKE